MVAKYLEWDCLYVSNAEAVNKMDELLERMDVVELPESKFDSTPEERDAFLRKVNGR